MSEAQLNVKTSSIVRRQNFSGIAFMNKNDLDGFGFLDCNFENARFEADITGAQFTGCNMRGTYFSNVALTIFDDCNFTGANFADRNLYKVNFYDSWIYSTNFTGATISKSNFGNCLLNCVEMRGTVFKDTTFGNTSLNNTNISGASGLLDPVEWLAKNFEHTDEGIIVYRASGSTTYSNHTPAHWKFEPGAYLTETCNPSRESECASGVNFATKDWVLKKYPPSGFRTRKYWKCLIEWKDAPGIVVPFQTNGKARCSRLKILEEISQRRKHEKKHNQNHSQLG